MHERGFRAMNTDVHLVLSGAEADAESLLDAAAAEFVAHERALSRFDPASDLSALNRAGSRRVRVPPLLCHALAAARAAALQTEGLFSSAVLPALEAAGYDRSFEHLVHANAAIVAAGAPTTSPAAAQLAPAVSAAFPYALSAETCLVALAPGVRLDLGGIGKGLAVDAAAARLSGGKGFLVDAGGDIRVGGESPDGGLWGVAVQDPRDLDRDIAVIALTDGAVATSSVARRRWLRDGAEQHHLIDPRTGRSAATDVLAATVIAPDCATAEVWAKAIVIAGSERGFALVARQQLAALIVNRDHQLRVNQAMRPFLVSVTEAVPTG